MNIEAMKLALEALEEVEQTLRKISAFQIYQKYYEAITALRTAINQAEKPVATLFGSLPVYDAPPKQEPVAWIHNFIDGGFTKSRPNDLDRYPDRWTALYKDPTPCKTCEALARTVMMDQTSHDTAPPPREWVGLTDEEHTQIAIDCGCATADWVFYGAAVERKLKEKNT